MSIQSVGVVGAGTMGRGIAQVCATSGLNVTLVDINEDLLQQAIDGIAQSMERLVRRDRLAEADMQAALGRIQTSTSLESVANAEIVIEAATENTEIKLGLFAQLGEICAPGTILASNTSSISLTVIAAASGRPGQVIGMHFFNPVPVMRLIEIIRALQTEDWVYDATAELARSLDRDPIEAKDSPGFVVNRMLVPMINEAALSLSEGLASAEDIDAAMRLGANHPMGPLALADLIGLDVCLDVMDVLHSELGESKYRPCTLLKQMVAAGYLGRKAGRGFFRYE